jgi:hypothetical protein
MKIHYEAVGIHIFGQPGVGKSNALNIMIADLHDQCYADMSDDSPDLVYQFGKENPRDLTNADVYNWNTESEYFSEYHNQKFFVADDPFQLDDEKIRSGIAAKIIHLVNILKYNLNQAELERKGKVSFESDFFLMTTNSREFPNNIKVEDIGAVERRIHFRVEQKVKPEYGYLRHDPRTQSQYYALDLSKLPKAHEDQIAPYEFYLHERDTHGGWRVYRVDWEVLIQMIVQRWNTVQTASLNPMLQRKKYNDARRKVAEMKEKENATVAMLLGAPPAPRREIVAQALNEVTAYHLKPIQSKLDQFKANIIEWYKSAKQTLAAPETGSLLKIVTTFAGLGALYFIGRRMNPFAMQVSGDPKTVVSNTARIITKKRTIPGTTPPQTADYVAHVQDPNALNILTNLVAKNLYVCSWASKDPDSGVLLEGGKLHCTFIEARTFITARHWMAFQGKNKYLHLRNPYHDILIDVDDLEVRPWPVMADGVLITIKNNDFPAQKKLTNHIADSSAFLGDLSDVVTLHYETQADGTMIPMASSGKCRYHLKPLTYHDGSSVLRLEDYLSIQLPANYGHCGKIYLAMNTRMQHKIIGMHVSGAVHTVESIAAPMFELLDHTQYEAHVAQPLVIPPHLEDCGTLPPNMVPRLPNRTSIVPSPFAPYMESKGFVPKTTPARLAPGLNKDGELKSPAQEGLYNYPVKTSKCPLDTEDLELFTECCHETARRLPGRVLPPTSTLDFDECINGRPGLTHIGKFNMSTAVGMPYTLERKTPGKWDFIKCDSCPVEKRNACRDVTHHLAMTESFEAKVALLELKVMNNKFETEEDYAELCDLIMIMNCLKDERVKIAKYDAFKTRIFNIMPLDFSVLKKKYYGIFVENMMSDPVNSPSSMGLNVHSPDWGMFWKRNVRKRNYPGDYITFDQSHAQWLSEHVDKHVILRWFQIHFAGYEPDFEDKQFMRMKLAYMTHNSPMVMLNKLYRSPGSNPSGDFTTTAKNISVEIPVVCSPVSKQPENLVFQVDSALMAPLIIGLTLELLPSEMTTLKVPTLLNGTQCNSRRSTWVF